MKNRELIERVKEKIHDASFTPSMILAKLNKGVGRIANLVDLPDLKSSDTVETGEDAYVSLPSDAGNVFHRKDKSLFFVSSDSQDNEVTIEESWIKFLGKWPTLDDAGNVQQVCVRGSRLYFQPIPSTADTLTLHFFRRPVAMTANSSDEPDGIPEDLQEDLLVNFACWDIYSQKEDEDGKTPETDKYKGLFAQALAELKLFVGPKDDRPDYYDYDEEDFI